MNPLRRKQSLSTLYKDFYGKERLTKAEKRMGPKAEQRRAKYKKMFKDVIIDKKPFDPTPKVISPKEETI